jgi:hypothetical protein
MYIYTKLILDPNGNVLEKEGYEYEGPVAECKGASQEQKDLAAEQAALTKKQSAFFDVMSASYNKMFEGQSAILATLQKTFAPIVAAGPSQYGLSKAEDTAMRTMASEGTAQSYKMAKQAVAEGQAAASGDAFIPKGADAQVKAQLASAAASQESQQQLGITSKGYDVGRQQYWKAAEALGGVAHEMNPIGYSGETSGAGRAATEAGRGAFDDYTTIYKENKADSGWSIAGGILGGALSAGVSGFTGGFGSALGKAKGGG